MGSFAEQEPEQSAENIKDLVDLIRGRKIHKHIHKVYALQEVPQALQDLIDRKIKRKAVVAMAR